MDTFFTNVCDEVDDPTAVDIGDASLRSNESDGSGAKPVTGKLVRKNVQLSTRNQRRWKPTNMAKARNPILDNFDAFSLEFERMFGDPERKTSSSGNRTRQPNNGRICCSVPTNFSRCQLE